MSIRLEGKVCLITGGDSGIGLGLVRGFVGRGAHVAAGLLDASVNAGKVAPALPVQLDVTQSAQVGAAVEKVVATYGRIDVLINNAGIYPRKNARDMTWDDWKAMLAVNLDGAFCCCQSVIPHFLRQESGVIINVGSVAFTLGLGDLSHYHASKGALVGLTRGLARDLGPAGIRVNGVHPGAVCTETERHMFPDQAAVEKSMDLSQSLKGRQTPESIEPVFAFLASDESRDITGQFIAANRGWAFD